MDKSSRAHGEFAVDLGWSHDREDAGAPAEAVPNDSGRATASVNARDPILNGDSGGSPTLAELDTELLRVSAALRDANELIGFAYGRLNELRARTGAGARRSPFGEGLENPHP